MKGFLLACRALFLVAHGCPVLNAGDATAVQLRKWLKVTPSQELHVIQYR